MHKLFLRLAFLTAAFIPAASALAADLDVLPPPPPVEELRPATYDWTGGYVGLWAGAACVDGSLKDNTSAAAGLPYQWEVDGCGSKGGIMAGYLHQFDQFVVGAEVDWGMTSRLAENNSPGADFAFRMKNLVTGRVRAGYAFDDTLLYATGGLAWAQGEFDGINGHPIPKNLKGSHKGFSMGGGMEHAVNDRLRLRVEYLYTNFGKENYKNACCDLDVKGFDDHEFKVGAIWAF